MTQYGKKTAESIISDYLKDVATIEDTGVLPIEDVLKLDRSFHLHWNYSCELEEFDALEFPSLPIPFSANQLAAFMLDGIGAYVRAFYGEWEDGPCKEMLVAMGPLANKPREALIAAFNAYNEAEHVVGKFESKWEGRAQKLTALYEKENSRFNSRESVFAQGLSIDVRKNRREHARASIEKLKSRRDKAIEKSNEDFFAWRKAMVIQILNQEKKLHDVAIPLDSANSDTLGDPKSDKRGRTMNRWDDNGLRQLLKKSNEPGMTHQKLADANQVSRQFIGKLLAKAKSEFEPRRASPFDALKHGNRRK